MRSLALLLSIVAGLGVAGCSSYELREPASPPLVAFGAMPPSTARVCTVRTSVLAQAVTFPTRDNGVLVGATRGQGHFCWLVEPGPHQITIETDQIDEATLVAEAGKSYYLKQDVDFVFGVVTCRPVWVDAEAAREAIEGTPYEVLSGVPGSEKLPSLPPFVRARPPVVQHVSGE